MFCSEGALCRVIVMSHKRDGVFRKSKIRITQSAYIPNNSFYKEVRSKSYKYSREIVAFIIEFKLLNGIPVIKGDAVTV